MVSDDGPLGLGAWGAKSQSFFVKKSCFFDKGQRLQQ
jgi:hypothetical protein